MSDYVPKYQYPIDEWLKHFEHFFRSPYGSNKEELLRYFRDEFLASPKEGGWKMNRCGTALAYLMRYLDDFQQFVVSHERKALVSKPIVVGLWYYYSRIPDEHLMEEPDAGRILELAQDGVA